MKFSAVLLCSLVAAISAEVPSLVDEDFDQVTEGKAVFVKFFAPW